LDPDAPSFVLLWLFIGTWAAGVVLLVADASAGGPRSLVDLVGYTVFSLAVWLAFAVVHLAWIDWRPPTDGPAADGLLRIAAHVSNTVSILYAFVFFLLCVVPLLAWRHGAAAAVFSKRWPGYSGLYLVAFAGALLVVATNLAGARADAVAKLGKTLERDGKLNPAQTLYAEAHRMQPTEANYASDLARLLMRRAGATDAGPQERIAYLQQALAAIERARTLSIDPAHLVDLARVHRLWATQAADPAEQRWHVGLGESYYRQATERSPRKANLWKEWATFDLERQRMDDALGKLEASVRLDHDPRTTELIEQIKRTHGAGKSAGEE
jgi:hypothetical protein